MDRHTKPQDESLRERLLAPFRNRPDTEHEQALVRITIVLLVLLYLSLVALFGEPSQSARHGLIVLSLYLLFSIVVITAIALNPAVSVFRRAVSMCGDIGMITYLLLYYGETMTPLYVVYLWVSSGYGLRYGNRYLAAATVLAASGFLLVLLNNDYWVSNATIGWGLWIGLIVLPLYIASLLAKLSRALSAAEAANQAKSRFIANMSHEIRTPINGVMGMLELLGATPLQKKQKTLLQDARSSTATLQHLLEDVLDMSKIEAGRASLQHGPFDLHAMINAVMSMFDYAAVEKGLSLQKRIDPSCPYRLVGDELHLRQILMNLVSNAIKFTQHGRIEIRLHAEWENPYRVGLRLAVMDTGIGISKEALHYIFEPFRQEDERLTRRYGGTGLGMSIARQLAELMGGELSVESELGSGSVFTLALECERQEEITDFSPLHLPYGIYIASSDRDLIGRMGGWLDSWHITWTQDLSAASAMSKEICLLDARQYELHGHVVADCPGISPKNLVLLLDEDKPVGIEKDVAGAVILRLPVSRESLYNVLHSFQASSFDIDNSLEEALHEPAYPLQTGKILVADDNRINQQVTRNVLEQHGHHITVVDDGKAALALLEREQFDLAIVDMMMPGLGGLDVISQYRYLVGENSDLLFIVLTANVSEEARALCEALGVTYLSKPLQSKTLQTTVQHILRPGVQTKIAG